MKLLQTNEQKGHKNQEKIWVCQDLNGQSPQRVHRAEQVAGLMGIEPVDDFPFTEHEERLREEGTGQRSD